VSAETKLELLGLIDGAVADGWAHTRACRVLDLADVRAHRWRQRLRETGSLEDGRPVGDAVHRLLESEEQAILDLIEQWGWVDRSHRKLAHRGSYTGTVFVSPSTLLRVALKHRVTLPGEPFRPRPVMPALPEIPWERNRIWIWDCSHFTRAKRVAYTIVDVVTRYWIGYLLTTEQTSTQAQLLFARALEDQGLLGPDGLPPERGPEDPPILVAWSDNGSEMTAIDTRQFMALMAITQHHGRPGTPTDQAHIESFFSHLKGDWPHLTGITDPAALDAELARIRTEYNTTDCTPRSGTSPPTTSIMAAGPRSAALARPGCAALARSGSSRIEPPRDDQPRDHRSRPSRPASVGRSVPARGGRPPARTSAEPGMDDASELAPNTHQPAPPPQSALG
jgi:transposase InsO family protein